MTVHLRQAVRLPHGPDHPGVTIKVTEISFDDPPYPPPAYYVTVQYDGDRMIEQVRFTTYRDARRHLSHCRNTIAQTREEIRA